MSRRFSADLSPTPPYPFSRYLIGSLFLHVLVFALLLFLKPTERADRPILQEQQVTWIQLGTRSPSNHLEGLPSGAEKSSVPSPSPEREKKTVKPVIQPEKRLPISEKQPAKPRLEPISHPKPKSEKTPNKPVVAEVKLPSSKPQKKPEAVKPSKTENPKPSSVTPKPVKPSKEEGEMNAALKKIQKEVAEEGRPQAHAGASSPGGQGDPEGKKGGSNSECAAYKSQVNRRVQGNWTRFAAGKEKGVARRPVIFVRINARGEILSPVWEQKSGDLTLDGSAMRAIQASSPFPPPPANCEDALKSGFTIQFGR